MGVTRHVVLCVMVWACVWGGPTAQSQPPRDRAVAPAAVAAEPAGTGSISGVVVAAGDSPTPMRHVKVSLMRGQMSSPRSTMTDDQGRFTFSALVDDQYVINAEKPGWVPVARSQQMAGAAAPGIRVAVDKGAAVSNVVMRVQRGGVIAGVVRWPSGRPASGLSVTALGIGTIDGRRISSMQAQPVTTDEQGRYRAFGLLPGQYVVQVQQSMFNIESLMGVDAGGLRQVLPSEVRWAEALLAPTPGTTPAPAPPPGPTVEWAPTYAPNTAAITNANVIEVGPGDERSNVDIELQLVPTTTISGTVTRPDGTPAGGASVSLQLPASMGQEDLMGQMMGAARGVTRPDGTFSLGGVRPGAYELTVRAAPAGARGAQAMNPLAGTAIGAMAMGGMPSGTLWAREQLVVEGQAIAPLALHLRDMLTVSGRVVFEGAPAPTSGVRVTLGTASTVAGLPDIAMFRNAQAVAQVNADGTFAATGALPGTLKVGVMMAGMRLFNTVPGTGWMISSVRLGDRDVTDDGLEVTDHLSGVVVTLTNTPSELTGRVLAGDGRPLFEMPVVIFPEDRAFWKAGSRRVVSAQPSTDGRYVVAGLPAGRYLMAVVTALDTRELTSAAFLESLVGSAIPIVLATGERKVQDIRLR